MSRSIIPAILTALLLALVGCDSGSSSGSKRGGPITGTVTLNAFTGFAADATVLDAAAGPAGSALVNDLFLLEGPIPFSGPDLPGTIRVVDFDSLQQVRSFTFSATDLPNSVGMGMRIEADLGILYTAGQPDWERVWLFHPATANGPASVTSYATNLSIDPGGRTSSDGSLNNPFEVSQTAGALAVEDKLYVVANSFFINGSSEPSYHPGVVLVFDLDRGSRTVTNPTAPKVIFTTDYNPSGLTLIPAGDGGPPFVAVVETGEFADFGVHAGALVGSVEFIDTSQDEIVLRIQVGVADPGFNTRYDAERRRLYVASASAPEVYVLDVAGLAAFRGAQGITNDTGRLLRGPTRPLNVPLHHGGGSFLTDMALSKDNAYLYVVNYNDSALTAFDLTEADPVVAGQFVEFGEDRTGQPTNFENLLNWVELRQGTFAGPELWGVTLFIAPQNGLPAGVTAAIDTIETEPQ